MRECLARDTQTGLAVARGETLQVHGPVVVLGLLQRSPLFFLGGKLSLFDRFLNVLLDDFFGC